MDLFNYSVGWGIPGDAWTEEIRAFVSDKEAEDFAKSRATDLVGWRANRLDQLTSQEMEFKRISALMCVGEYLEAATPDERLNFGNQLRALLAAR